MFKDFQAQWPRIDKSSYKVLKLGPAFEGKQSDVIDFCFNSLQSKMPRDDYKECIDLVLAILGLPHPKFTFKKPGAFHKARWMASILYSLKMYMFSDQLQMTQDELDKLERLVIFICTIYIKYWVLVPNARDAPALDLWLYKSLLELGSLDTSFKSMSDRVLAKLSKHTWYMNQVYLLISALVPNKRP